MKKICEKCGSNEFEATSSRKYCNDCKIIVRREQSREYAKRKGSGIYKIVNITNGKLYIGQSKILIKRLNQHMNELKNNTHYNDHLQRSWNKYGEDNFLFEVIENCDVDELYERENYWINYYNSHKSEYGYNATVPPRDGKKFSMSKEARLKLSKNKRVFEDDELTSYLHEYFYHFGKVPTVRELDSNELFPNSNTYQDRFGNYKEALIEAGLYDFVENKKLFDRKEYTKQEIYDKYRAFIDIHKRFPNNDEQRKTSSSNLPTVNMVVKHFGTIENLKKLLGINKDDEIQKENELALHKLKELYIKDGYVTSRTIDKSPITRSAHFYQERFGSLMNAYELIGIYTKEHVSKEIVNFHKIHNRLPSNKDIDTYKLPPKRIIALHYTAIELRELVGISDEILKSKENKEALTSLMELYKSQGFVDESTINKFDITKSAKFYCVRFGSLKNACLEARIPLEGLVYKTKIS